MVKKIASFVFVEKIAKQMHLLLTNEKSKYHITYVNFPQPSLRLVNNYDYRACCVQVGTAENKVTYL